MALNNGIIISNTHLNALSPELFGFFLQMLTVIDRLRCERVSPRWKWLVEKFGWTKQRKLNRKIVFEGISPENLEDYYKNFWNKTIPGERCHLASLFHRLTNHNLMELNLASFGDFLKNCISELAPMILLFPKLEKLNIGDLMLADFMNFLPKTLRRLKTYSDIDQQTLEIFSIRCPNLEFVPFSSGRSKLNLATIGEYIGRFKRQKKLDLFHSGFIGSLKTPNLISIGELAELEVLLLWNFNVIDENALVAITNGCVNLRRLLFNNTRLLTDASMLHLAKLPNLNVLELCDTSGAFNDSVLKAIAKRGKLKRLWVRSDALSDESILILLDWCKSMVSLDISYCMRISERSLEAVIAYVQNRQGNPTGELPNGLNDKSTFILGCEGTKIDMPKAHKIAAENPWLVLRRS